ncbi:hypothetical protein JCM6882_001190 [Rhodosporidiobolus microsporus]
MFPLPPLDSDAQQRPSPATDPPPCYPLPPLPSLAPDLALAQHEGSDSSGSKRRRHRKHVSCEGDCVYVDCEPIAGASSTPPLPSTNGESSGASDDSSTRIAYLSHQLYLKDLEIDRLRLVIVELSTPGSPTHPHPHPPTPPPLPPLQLQQQEPPTPVSPTFPPSAGPVPPAFPPYPPHHYAQTYPPPPHFAFLPPAQPVPFPPQPRRPTALDFLPHPLPPPSLQHHHHHAQQHQQQQAVHVRATSYSASALTETCGGGYDARVEYARDGHGRAASWP